MIEPIPSPSVSISVLSHDLGTLARVSVFLCFSAVNPHLFFGPINIECLSLSPKFRASDYGNGCFTNFLDETLLLFNFGPR